MAGRMIYPVQIQAARSLLGLSQTELAKRASIGLRDPAAAGERWQRSTRFCKNNLEASASVEAGGIIFIDQDEEHGPGVRLRKPLP